MSKVKARLTWLDDRGKRTGILVDRPGRTLLITQAAWATLAGREPLLDGKVPYTKIEAQALLELLSALPNSKNMAQRALNTLQRAEERS